jgi:hypothetical protein
VTNKYKALTHSKLLQILDYDPISGVFLWKKVAGSRRHMSAGSLAGTVDKMGARVIAIKGCLYYAHRLAWFYVHKRWPHDSIDHRDMNPLNNAISNLRVATRSQNNANSRARSHNRLGLKGVRKHGRKYVALISVKKRPIRIGAFESPEEAHAAYLAKAKEVYGEFARGG